MHCSHPPLAQALGIIIIIIIIIITITKITIIIALINTCKKCLSWVAANNNSNEPADSQRGGVRATTPSCWHFFLIAATCCFSLLSLLASLIG
jgi:hypothetical protein